MDFSGSRSSLMTSTAGLSLRRAAMEAPSRLALVMGSTNWTFSQLWAHVAADVAHLRVSGVEPAQPLALVGSNDLPTLVRVYAAIEIGLPLALLHARSPEEEHRRWIDVWNAQTVSLSSCGERRSQTPVVQSDGDVPALDPESTLAIVRTSGTSGDPKGVRLSRRAFAASASASASNLGWKDDDRWLLALPIAHVGGLSILLRCLQARRTVVVDTSDHFDPSAMVQRIDSQRVTLLSVVPTMLRRLLEVRDSVPSSLRAVLVGGGAASPEVMAQAVSRGWPVLATYGCTEACSQITTQALDEPWSEASGSGRPLAGQQVRIQDSRIEFRGPTLMSGFLPPGGEPFTQDGWLRSGDLGHLDEQGNLHVHGRADDVIISGGENVSPLRVERILERHPAVRAACVFAVPDPNWGQRVEAAVVAQPDAEKPSPETWDGFLRLRLAPYERPKRVAWIEALCLNSVGKLDRRATAREVAEIRS